MPLNRAALCQPCDGLVDHRKENAAAHICFLSALVQQGLDVRLGEYTAAGSDGISLCGLGGQLVHLIRGQLHQSGHLIDECTGAAGTSAIHTHFCAASQKQDLGIFAPQLDDHIRAGQISIGCQAGGVDFLNKRNAAAGGHPHAGRTGDGEGHCRLLRVLLPDAPQHLRRLFGDLGKMTLVTLGYQGTAVIQNHAFDGGGADVYADLQTSHLINLPK